MGKTIDCGLLHELGPDYYAIINPKDLGRTIEQLDAHFKALLGVTFDYKLHRVPLSLTDPMAIRYPALALSSADPRFSLCLGADGALFGAGIPRMVVPGVGSGWKREFTLATVREEAPRRLGVNLPLVQRAASGVIASARAGKRAAIRAKKRVLRLALGS